MRVPLEECIERDAHTRLERRRSFAAGDQIPVRLISPARPGFRESIRKVLGAQAFPLTEKDLAQLRHRLRRDAQRLADQLRRLGRTFQVARVKADELPSRQTPPQLRRLAPTFLRKWGVELALDTALVIPGRLAVAHKQ